MRAELRASYEALAPMIRGCAVICEDAGGGSVSGTTTGLADDGGLRILTPGGVEQILRAGAVHSLREVTACSS